MRYIVSVLITVLCFSSAGYAQNIEGVVSIKGDLGLYLSVCTGCQQTMSGDYTSFNTATVHAQNANDWFARFTLTRLSNGNYTIQSERGGYMCICTGCIKLGTTQDFITFHATSPESYAQFQIRQLSNGKYTIQSVHNGKYVTRCNGCSPTSSQVNTVTAHVASVDMNMSYAQWEINVLRPSIEGTVSFRGDLGTYLSLCTGCQQTVNSNYTSFNTATLHAVNNAEWFTHFTATRLPNGNYTFQSERGGYMAVCRGCIKSGTYEDFITFHATSPENYAQFQLTQLPNGKYTIRSVYNGKYVTRCGGCSPTSTQSNQVTAHVQSVDANTPFAQWEIIKP